MLVILLVLVSSSNWEIRDTGIFTAFGHQKFAIDDEGSVYILDPSENTVLKYDAASKFVKRIGRSGQGPDGIYGARSIALIKGRLYVHGVSHVNEFRLDGTPIDKHKTLVQGTAYSLQKLVNGWAAVSNKPQSLGSLEGKTGSTSSDELCWFSDDFKDKRVLASWPKMASPYTREGLKYNPVYPLQKLVVSVDRSYFFFKKPTEDEVLLFDADLNKHVIPFTEKKVPFSRDWGLQQFRRFQQENPNIKAKASFPEFFPLISNMGVFANGYLGVEIRKGVYERGVRYFDSSGTEVEPKFKVELLKRTLATRGEYTYLIFQAETEEFAVSKVKAERIDAFLKANPRL